ncbi:MAG: glycosyltransferase family 2 protein [Candidatus Levybacteria bacterium]|nr:glycosyltransferase family 2 protein [Candidatus Levybacteria bacterium]
MNKISVIIITKNEEEMIVDCMESVKELADEIVVVDSGSEDRTCEIVEKMGAKVYSHKEHDFSDLRNLGLEKAKGDWIFYIDADERATQELASSIIHQVCLPASRLSNVGAFKVKRKNFYLGNHEWPTVEKMERVFKKSALKGWHGKLHETPDYIGKTGELEGFLLHYTHQSLTAMLSKTIEWSKIEAELRLKANHPKITWWRFPRVMILAFFNSYIKQKGWKVGMVGLIESIYQSFSMFITYARLWEMQNNETMKQ